MSVPSNVVNLLRLTFGELPDIRLDTPLTSLGFHSADAVVLASLDRTLTERPLEELCLTDRAFAGIETVGDLAAAVGGVSHDIGK
jgi:hypothetical protein